jgi:hypothetical protein
MLNYLKKFAVDIFPSVAATVIGAYIVNHYIVSKPATDAPAAAASTANPKGEGKAEAKSDAKPTETTASVSNLPAAGVKAKGISEKAIMEKNAAERPAVVEKAQEKTEAKADAKEVKADAKPDIKSADTKSSDSKSDVKSAEARPIPTSAVRHQRRAKRKRSGSYCRRLWRPRNSPAAPVVATAPAAPVEPAVVPDERREARDANDLARAAIERLRANGETSPRTPENGPRSRGAQGSECARGQRMHPGREPAGGRQCACRCECARASSAAAADHDLGLAGRRTPWSGSVAGTAALCRGQQPEPPDPARRDSALAPLDLRAEVAEPSVRERATAAAEDALSTAKSIFHAVLPK